MQFAIDWAWAWLWSSSSSLRPNLGTSEIYDGSLPTSASVGSYLRVFTSTSSVKWIDGASEIAKSGLVQASLVVAVFLWSVRAAARRPAVGTLPIGIRASKIRLPYEISSQLARCAALVLAVIGAHRTPATWINVPPVGLAFLLGLVRLSSGARWRHVVLHQVNFLLAASFLTLLTADILPLLTVDHHDGVDAIELGVIGAVGAACLAALVTPREWLPPPLDPDSPFKIPDPKPSPEETCSWFVRFLTYEFITSMVWTGWRRPLEMEDLPDLPWYDEPLTLLPQVLKAREKYKKTLWTIVGFQRRQITLMMFWVAMIFSLELVSPFAMYQLLKYLATPKDAVFRPALWLFLLFAGSMSRSVAMQQYVFTSTRFLVRCRSGMIQELYHRAMGSMELEEDVINKIATRDAKEEQEATTTSIGRLANLMSSDLDAVFRTREIFFSLVGVPIGLTITCYGLYEIIGWPSLVGIGFMIITTPLPVYMAKLMSKAQRRIKMAQDSRISLLSEYLASIKAIKYFAWEDAITERIQSARSKEQNELWRIDVFNVLVSEGADAIPIITLLIIFGLYIIILNQPLTAAVAFTTVSLINTLRRNIGMSSWLFRAATDALISLERLDKYFSHTEPLVQFPEGPLKLQNTTFRRSKNASFRLKDISLDFVEGGLNVISGQSGSGKTSLLLAMLGELPLEAGTVTIPKDIAFASQTPWLQNETIKENIIFHTPFEQVRYDRVIEACCFEEDLKQLPKGDQTKIGESGTILSGGQKSRVALARALYSKSPVVFLDDIFSALDAKTAASLWEFCFCTDMLKGRTVVLVTQLPWIAAQADFSIVMEAGTILSTERNLGVVRKVIAPQSANGEEHNGNGTDSTDKPAEPTEPDSPDTKADEISDEMESSERVSRLTILRYLRYFGNSLFIILLFLSTVIGNALLIFTSYWLSRWVDAYDGKTTVNIAFYAGIYTACQIFNTVLDGGQYLLYARGAWIAARRLHRGLLVGVLNAPLSWWKNIPVGRVVNRFSKDIKAIDNTVGIYVYLVLDLVISLLFRIGAVSSILPVFMLPALFSVSVGIACGEMYTRTAVVLKRLLSSCHSPVFSQFNDTMTGLTIIRAGGEMPKVFTDQLANRMRKLSRAQEATFNLNRWVSIRVDTITALVSVLAGIIAVTKSSVLGAGLVGFSLSNVTGLSSTILALVRFLNELEVEFQAFVRVEEYIKLEPEEKTENEEAAVISASTYSNSFIGEQPLPIDWPRTGSVELRNVTIRYDLDGPDILKDINLKFEAGERVAVVGRTGSGKSTLVLSLLRFTDIVSGQIFYDGVDITTIPRKKLRRALTIIPQEAVLFNGTLHTNLDPSGQVPSEVLESALDSCSGIASFQHRGHDERDVQNGDTEDSHDNESSDTAATEQTPLLLQTEADPAGNGTITPTTKLGTLSLSTTVKPKGENFSHGQRQVLSLCRALIRKSKLMLLDEATASMDYETDRGIQVVLRNDMAADGAHNRTLVTIAHRLRTIIDYDKVVVMGEGRVLEVGSPRELYNNHGVFFDMVKHSGEGDELRHILEGEEGGDDNTEVGSEE